MLERKLLMIPGPIEFAPEVLETMSLPTLSHVDPMFIDSFGHALEMMRKVWQCPSGQPFVVAGSGTLAMDMAGANLIEPGDRVLVASTGYFGERYAALLRRYAADVTLLKSEIGHAVPIEVIESELEHGYYKLMAFTHVDTSTGVLVDPIPMADLARKYGVLSILDGVCSVAGEEVRQEEWGIDVVVTASQKAVGVPPGLALMVVSQHAINVWKNRISPVGNYYCDWTFWLPIMQAYEARKPSYFATPPVNLVQALETSLQLILDEGLEARFLRHRKMAETFRSAMRHAGLKVIPASDGLAAHTLTAPFYPDGIDGGTFLKRVADNGVVIAGGLLPHIKAEYFRVGHMGIVDDAAIEMTITAIRAALKK